MAAEKRLLEQLRDRSCVQGTRTEEKAVWDTIRTVGIPEQSLDPISAASAGDERELTWYSMRTTVRGYLEALMKAARAAIGGPMSGQNEESLVSLCSAMNGLATTETLDPVDFPPFVCHRIIHQLAAPIRIHCASYDNLYILRNVVDVGNASGDKEGSVVCWYTRTVACAIVALADMKERDTNGHSTRRRIEVCIKGSFGGPLEGWLSLRSSAIFADAPIAYEPKRPERRDDWRRTMREVSDAQQQRSAAAAPVAPAARPARPPSKTARMMTSGPDPNETDIKSEGTASDTEIWVAPTLRRKQVGTRRVWGMFSTDEP